MAEVVEKKEEKAKGPLFGGAVSVRKVGDKADILQEDYGGYSELVVKCTRGEQKAEIGDKAYLITIHDKHDETKPGSEFLILIPGPVVTFIDDLTTTVEPMTVEEYSEYQTSKSKSKPSASVTQTRTAPPSPPTPAATTRSRV